MFTVNPDKEVSGKTDAGVALLNLYNFMSVDSSNSEALIKLNKVFLLFSLYVIPNRYPVTIL